MPCFSFLAFIFFQLFTLVGKNFCAFVENSEITSIPEYATATPSGDFLYNSQPFEIGYSRICCWVRQAGLFNDEIGCQIWILLKKVMYAQCRTGAFALGGNLSAIGFEQFDNAHCGIKCLIRGICYTDQEEFEPGFTLRALELPGAICSNPLCEFSSRG